jgi:hypothetical protein
MRSKFLSLVLLSSVLSLQSTSASLFDSFLNEQTLKAIQQKKDLVDNLEFYQQSID